MILIAICVIVSAAAALGSAKLIHDALAPAPERVDASLTQITLDDDLKGMV